MSGKRTAHWRRPVTKMYDYNYNLGEHYYRPQLSYLGDRKGRSPPRAKTFAERFAEDPFYGKDKQSRSNVGVGGDTLRPFGSTRSLLEADSMDDLKNPKRFGSMGNLNSTEDKLFKQEAQNVMKETSKLMSSTSISEGTKMSSMKFEGIKRNTSVGRDEDDFGFSFRKKINNPDLTLAIDEALPPIPRRKKLQFAQTADPELITEDPFKTRALEFKKKGDELMNEMKDESEGSTSRFRARIEMRKQKEANKSSIFDDDYSEELALISKANQIRQRSKARLAQLEDEYPELNSITSMGVSRTTRDPFEFDDSLDSNLASSSRFSKLPMKSLKSSLDFE